jgi:hypothetical protein
MNFSFKYMEYSKIVHELPACPAPDGNFHEFKYQKYYLGLLFVLICEIRGPITNSSTTKFAKILLPAVPADTIFKR